MIYNIPIQSTTIYSQYPQMNTGLDQVLTLRKNYYNTSSNYLSRLLFKCNFTPALNKLNITTSSIQKMYLKLYSTSEQYLSYGTVLQCYGLYKDWQQGVGMYQPTYQDTDGCS